MPLLKISSKINMSSILFSTTPFLGSGPKFTSLKLRRRHSLTIDSSSSAAPAPVPVPKTFYEVLGIEAGATSQDIKTAYRNIARAVHPDVAASNGSDSADLFIRIHVAYSTLSDPRKRSDYDRTLFQRRTCGGQTVLRIRRNWETDQCW